MLKSRLRHLCWTLLYCTVFGGRLGSSAGAEQSQPEEESAIASESKRAEAEL